MTIGTLLVAIAVALSLVMMGAWSVALRSGRSGWIDAIWSFAIGGAGVVAALVPLAPGEPTARQILVAVLGATWALRLGWHITRRTLGGGDDPRYAQLRDEWGAAFRQRLFLFLQIQAACAFVLAVSMLVAAHNPAPHWRVGDAIGVLLIVVAIGGEAVSDQQLTRFRRDRTNHGKVCDVGLWGMSRHPNYFFEWLGWLAYGVIAIGPGYAWGWLALSGPILMYLLLVHASGIPPLEAHMLRSRGVAFRAYQARVNAFWPGPQRANRMEPS
ncbi:MAG: DUF1295 domain-containing protein [Alphaproteobacteria bacterium]|nr:DUF1295 domain-containing protein [Alphaproteobacteria bacterium]